MKAISLKLDEKQLKLLDELSRTTHIPKSTLIRKGIDMIINDLKRDVIDPKTEKEIDQLVNKDLKLLRRLGGYWERRRNLLGDRKKKVKSG